MGEAMDEGKILSKRLSSVEITTVSLMVDLQSHDHYTNLSHERSSVYKSIPSDVNGMRYDFGLSHVSSILCISGSQKLADPVMRIDRPLNDVLPICMETGGPPFSFATVEWMSSSLSLF